MRRKDKPENPLRFSATFTAVEMYDALMRRFPERFPHAAKTGVNLFQAELHGDDILIVRYGPKR